MLEHPGIHAISFTGSVATGRKIAETCIRSDPMKEMQLEVGGKNPMVVLDDADLAVAVEACAAPVSSPASGERLNREAEGFYLAPALFTNATNAMLISREEIFGPIRVKDYAEALAEHRRRLLVREQFVRRRSAARTAGRERA